MYMYVHVVTCMCESEEREADTCIIITLYIAQHCKSIDKNFKKTEALHAHAYAHACSASTCIYMCKHIGSLGS